MNFLWQKKVFKYGSEHMAYNPFRASQESSTTRIAWLLIDGKNDPIHHMVRMNSNKFETIISQPGTGKEFAQKGAIANPKKTLPAPLALYCNHLARKRAKGARICQLRCKTTRIVIKN